MRIAQICPYDIARPGGVQRHVCDLSAALRERGHDVTIVAPQSPKSDTSRADYIDVDDPHVVRVGKSWPVVSNKTTWHVTLATGAARAHLDEVMKSGQFDVVHFHAVVMPFLSYQVGYRSRSTSANVATYHDVPSRSFAGAAMRLVYSVVDHFVLPLLDGMILASDVQAKLHNVALAKSHTFIPPCTDLDRFNRPHEPYGEFRDERLNVLYLGNLEPRKGVDVLLRAYRELACEGLPVRLIVVGDGPERDSLVRYAEQNQLPHVVFVGRVSDAAALRWYATADVVCAPAIGGEGFGIVLTEAMASGKPVVAAANDGYRRVLTGEGAQCLTPPGDIQALAAALRRLASDPMLRQRLGAWGRAEARRYDSRNLMPRFVAIYESAIEAAVRRRVAIDYPRALASVPLHGRDGPGRSNGASEYR